MNGKYIGFLGNFSIYVDYLCNKLLKEKVLDLNY